MSYRSVARAIVLALASLVLAGACAWRADLLGSQGAWLLLRSTAEAAEYTTSFDGQHVDQELRHFQARRAVLEQAQVWQRASSALVMAAALLLVASYGLFLLARLEEQRLASPDGGAAASPTAVQVR